MDKLKKHIKENRSKLDHIETPNGDKLWNNIRAELESNNVLKKSFTQLKKSDKTKIATKNDKQFSLWTLSLAASFALLIGVGVGYLLLPKTTETTKFDLANYDPSLAKQEQDYLQLVNTKKEELNFSTIDTVAFSEVLTELKQLEGEYEQWKKDVPQYIQEQELMDFLQRHYEQKIRILEILSKEIQKKKYYEEREIRL